MPNYDTVVIGAGLAGLTAAVQLARARQKVLLVATGIGALVLASGCIDVLGYQPAESNRPLTSPAAALPDFLAAWPDHPYHRAGRDKLEAGLTRFLGLVNPAGLAYQGSLERNWLLPTPAGAVHPTCLAPAAQANGELSQGGRRLIIGFPELRDFYPGLISQNLNAQGLAVETAALRLELPAPVTGRLNITPLELAQAFERPDFRRRLILAMRTDSRGYDRIGFPAVLGLANHAEVLADLQQQLGKTVFEISTLPPSVPGRRLFEQLRRLFLQAGGRLILGSKVVAGQLTAGRVSHIRLESAGRLRTIRAGHYVLASGGIFGGGIHTEAEGRVWEPIFGLPVAAPAERQRWFARQFIAPAGQPVGQFGLRVNACFNPVDQAEECLAENLFVAGASLAGADWRQGRCGEGIALASATAIVDQICQGK
jgi:glycerol-3-phosphate dehydrogenase subunit B